jgi:hypothetical protein
MARIEILMAGPQKGKILVDGVEVTEVVAVRFGVDIRPDSEQMAYAEIVLRHYSPEVVIDGMVEVTTLDNEGSRIYEAVSG